MTATIIEGTWEEVAQRAEDLAGKRVRLIVLEEASGTDRNHWMLHVTPEEWSRRVDEHAEKFKDFPGLPEEAFDRENLYDERF